MLKLLVSFALVIIGLAASTLIFNRPFQASSTTTRRVLLILCIGCVAAGLLAITLF